MPAELDTPPRSGWEVGGIGVGPAPTLQCEDICDPLQGPKEVSTIKAAREAIMAYVIGIPVAIVVILLAIIAGVCYWCHKKRRSTRQPASNEPQQVQVAIVQPTTDALPTSSLSNELANLAKLKADGVLTEKEFESAKAKLLGISPTAAAAAPAATAQSATVEAPTEDSAHL